METRARVISVAMPKEKGPGVFPLELGISAAKQYVLEGWLSGQGDCNVYILEGEPSLAQAQAEVQGEGIKNLIMTLTGTGPVWVPFSLESQKVTVFFEGENKGGLTQVVTLEIKEC